jgi:hypothetical protein
MSNKFNSDMVSDNQGVTIGKVGSYVKNFKDIEAGKTPTEPVRSSDKKSSKRPSSASVSLAHLPKELNSNTESEIFNHFYFRFGDATLNDFESVSAKIASSINRLYAKSFTIEETSKKLKELVNLENLKSNNEPQEKLKQNDFSEEVVKENKNLKSKISINLEEKMYPFYRGLESLSDEQQDLLMFIKTENLCFSSNAYEFFLTVKDKKCFDNLFNFNPKEQLVYNMFVDQLGDSYKAKKLVLMSRVLNSSTEELSKENSRSTKKKK